MHRDAAAKWSGSRFGVSERGLSIDCLPVTVCGILRLGNPSQSRLAMEKFHPAGSGSIQFFREFRLDSFCWCVCRCVLEGRARRLEFVADEMR